MKTYIATFKRHNIQLKKDYTVTRTIEAKTIVSARKKADEINSRFTDEDFRKLSENGDE